MVYYGLGQKIAKIKMNEAVVTYIGSKDGAGRVRGWFTRPGLGTATSTHLICWTFQPQLDYLPSYVQWPRPLTTGWLTWIPVYLDFYLFYDFFGVL
jgi:hypothetical protein